MSNRIVIRRKGNLVDVFHGETGWGADKWTRLVVLPGMFLKFVKGANLSPMDLVYVRKELQK